MYAELLHHGVCAAVCKASKLCGAMKQSDVCCSEAVCHASGAQEICRQLEEQFFFQKHDAYCKCSDSYERHQWYRFQRQTWKSVTS